jgi:hypothetical protein
MEVAALQTDARVDMTSTAWVRGRVIEALTLLRKGGARGKQKPYRRLDADVEAMLRAFKAQSVLRSPD